MLLKIAKFFTQNFTDDHRFLCSREMGKLKRVKRYVCKNLLNLDSQDSVRFDIYQITYK